MTKKCAKCGEVYFNHKPHICYSLHEKETEAVEEHDPSYKSLENVLQMALRQAQRGKGHERHANGKDFEDQPMMTISGLLGDSNKGCLYQAIKKIQESTRMDSDAAIRELLGAINYLGGAVIMLQEECHEWQVSCEGGVMATEEFFEKIKASTLQDILELDKRNKEEIRLLRNQMVERSPVEGFEDYAAAPPGTVNVPVYTHVCNNDKCSVGTFTSFAKCWSCPGCGHHSIVDNPEEVI